MATETTKAAPVDSRQPGFNPEVEASHAETAAAAAASAAATPEAPAAAAATPTARDAKTVALELFRELGDRLGNPPRVIALIRELEAL